MIYEADFTNKWWASICADEEKLIRWLQKLQQTEREGFDDNHEAILKYTHPHQDSAAIRVLKKTADDELRHAEFLVKILEDRGQVLVDSPRSTYWEEMSKTVHDLKTCAAVFHLGEGLAAWRFNILYNHPDTPSDVREWLKVVTPDEMYHEQIFLRLTDTSTLNTIKVAHELAVRNLKKQ